VPVSLSQRKRRVAEKLGPLAEVKVRETPHRGRFYRVNCRECWVRPDRIGGPSGERWHTAWTHYDDMAQLHMSWTHHLAEVHEQL
jgi:hypothetical protein